MAKTIKTPQEITDKLRDTFPGASVTNRQTEVVLCGNINATPSDLITVGKLTEGYDIHLGRSAANFRMIIRQK